MIELFLSAKAILTNTPAFWKGLVESLPAELLAREPAPGEWSALQCLQHIIDVEPLFMTRLRAFQAGTDFPPFVPTEHAPGEQPAAPALLETFCALRAASLAALAPISAAELPLTSRHPRLGPVTLAELVNELAAHDLNHNMQAERALMQPFIIGCGVWRVYFEEHIINK
jgi:uncharacterized damage-inducible protein DinB